MANLNRHPSVKRFRETQPAVPPREAPPLDAAWLRNIALDAGADDAGLVEIDHPALADQKTDILKAFPRTRTLLSFVLRMNRENIRTPLRSIANLEFHHTGDKVNEIARCIVGELERQGVPAMNGAATGFPMEMSRWPGKIWVVSHKPVAVAAGLGRMGIHRNVIHPKFGNFVLLGSVLVGREVSEYSGEIDYNPCLECKLCVAACPTGAIKPNGDFDFSACFTHNYCEFMGGFIDWVETVAESGNAKRYRARVTDSETVSMWQSLSFGPNYTAAYCMSVCPAGEDVIGPFLSDRKRFMSDVLIPLKHKPETVYVLAGSDAETHVARRFPAKSIKRVHNGLRPNTIDGFLNGLRFLFQCDAAAGLEATYHFTFFGEVHNKATITISNQILRVQDGHFGTPDLRVRADSRTWLRFLSKETGMVSALLRGRIRISGGSPGLLLAFGRCFPS